MTLNDVADLLDTHDKVNITLASIAEPGDALLGAMLAEYDVGTHGRRRFIDDLTRERLPFIDDTERAQKTIEGWRSRLSKSAVLRSSDYLQRVGGWSLEPIDAWWPIAFHGPGAPVTLFGRGDPRQLSSKSVSVVGARASTHYGEHVTGELVSGLVQRGYAIISGGAYGIDGTAHRVALSAGGSTIAFLAGGIDRFYPAGNEGLLQRVAATGAVVSEVAPGSPPTKWRFLQRNRLIAAIGHGTVVVEAGLRSGSLNTAGHAHRATRPVMAVPGPITSPASAGCHRLLREGATCVTSADDIIEVIEGPTTEEPFSD